MKNLKLFYYSLPSFLLKLISFLFSKVHNPIVFDFIYNPIGEQYGLNKKKRINILKKIIKIIQNIDSATSLETQITLAKYLLSLKKNKKGFIVECGCFKGASTATLSIISKIIDRKLIVYDSFEGLPKSANKTIANFVHLKSKENYRKGMYRGTLNTVKNNIALYGNLDVCVFRKGLFNKSLPYHNEKIEFLFMDVDLPISTEICIKFLWKNLIDDSYVFTDDSCDMDNIKIWFDNQWWEKNLKIKAPGYIGSGCGLPLNYKYSGLGYAIKKPNKIKYKKINWIK